MDWLKIYLPGGLLVALAFGLAYQFVEPAPPSTLRIAAGPEGGGYAAVAKSYAAALSVVGISLEIIETDGSVDNLRRLEAGEADLGFVQGGVPPGSDNPLLALGSMFLEPIWVFGHDPSIGRLDGLRGLRIGTGPEGSGTHVLAGRLLADNGIDSTSSEFHRLSSEDAAKALRREELDAAIFIASERSAAVSGLLQQQGLSLLSFERAAAYEQRYRFLTRVTLHEGAIDLARNIPPRSTELLAATAALVVRPNVHPALVDLLMQLARRIHRNGGLFAAPDAFPSPEGHVFELHDQARRFYDSGPPFLQRYLPFWAATLVDRMAVMLIPLLTLLLPLARILPPALDWRVRSKVYRWYENLRAVELESKTAASEERLSELHARLDRIEDQVTEISVPLTRSDLVYTLREHIAFIRQRLEIQRRHTK